MHALDSRTLGSVNTFIQKITDKGDLMIEAGKAASGFAPIDETRALKAKVKAVPTALAQDTAEVKQHDIPLRFEADNFVLETDKMDVSQGDVVVFHGAVQKQPNFAIRGQVGKQAFNSAALTDQAVFTHAFGLPGRYEWTDANGSGVGGVITVVNEPSDGKDGAERAMKRMGEGVLVHIVGKKVEPKELTISTGQTVFFAVEKTKGITITDVRLLAKGDKK